MAESIPRCPDHLFNSRQLSHNIDKRVRREPIVACASDLQPDAARKLTMSALHVLGAQGVAPGFLNKPPDVMLASSPLPWCRSGASV